jgi:energy-coupling factor transporter transmembrane protein EcfT
MNVKKTLESRIRGWLPKEPTLPSKSAQPQMPKENKPLHKPKTSFFWVIPFVIILFFYLFLFNSQASTLGYILIGITAAISISFMALRKSSHKRIVKFFKYVLIGIALFVLVFTNLGLYLFNFAGPIVPQVNDSNILDISLTQNLQTLEQSTSFRFLQTTHFGTLTLEDLSIHSFYSNAPGGLMWTFNAGDVKNKMEIGQSGGAPYFYDLIPHRDSLPQNYPSNEQISNSFNQIDSLGLHWFYNQAVAEYQNATGTKPTVAHLTLDVGFDNVSNYQGITLLITAQKTGQDNFGHTVYPGVFKVEFQPNGTILSSNNHPFP